MRVCKYGVGMGVLMGVCEWWYGWGSEDGLPVIILMDMCVGGCVR